jgi:hypothetical protein
MPKKNCKACGSFYHEIPETSNGVCERCRELEYNKKESARLSKIISDMRKEKEAMLRNSQEIQEIYQKRVAALSAKVDDSTLIKSDKDRWPMWIVVKETRFNISEDGIKKVLERIQPIADIVQIEYGRRDQHEQSNLPTHR